MSSPSGHRAIQEETRRHTVLPITRVYCRILPGMPDVQAEATGLGTEAERREVFEVGIERALSSVIGGLLSEVRTEYGRAPGIEHLSVISLPVERGHLDGSGERVLVVLVLTVRR